MKVRILNKETLKREVLLDHGKIAVISIQSPKHSEEIDINENVIDILYLFFYDVDKDYPERDIFAMTEEDAERVANFTKRNITRCNTLFVSCDAGISRSAGVAAAILKWWDGNDSPIFKGPYVPNMRCYNLTYKHLIGKEDK